MSHREWCAAWQRATGSRWCFQTGERVHCHGWVEDGLAWRSDVVREICVGTEVKRWTPPMVDLAIQAVDAILVDPERARMADMARRHYAAGAAAMIALESDRSVGRSTSRTAGRGSPRATSGYPPRV